MASSKIYVPVKDNAGNIQVPSSVNIYLNSGTASSPSYPGTPTATGTADSNGVVSIEVATSGLYRVEIVGSGNTYDDQALLNADDVTNIGIVYNSGVTQASLEMIETTTATATDLNKTTATAGVATASKALILGASGVVSSGTLDFDGVTWKIGGTTVSAVAGDLNLLDGLAAAGKTVATLDDINNYGNGGSGFGQDQRIDFDVSGNTFVTTIYKTVFGTKVKGNFRLNGVSIFTNDGTPANITGIQINKISPSGTATLLYENTALSFSALSGFTNGSICNLLTQAAQEGTVTSGHWLEVKLKITGTSISSTQITVFLKNTNNVIATGTTGGNL